MAPGIPSINPCSGFLDLPLELRQQVYEEYLSLCSLPDIKELHEDSLLWKHSNFTLPLSLVNKQVSEEVLDVLKRRQQYVYRITWQEAGLDGLARSCIRARQIRVNDYASIPHLEIDIYPPHPDRPSDMMNMLRSIQELCKELRAIDRLQHISIVFIENDIATWSTAGKPRKSMGYWQELEDDPDIEYVLYLFATLTNCVEATIRLPESLPPNSFLRDEYEPTLQELKVRHEQSMMNVNLLDEELVSDVVEILEQDLNDEELYIKQDTGRKSLAKLKALGYGDRYTMERGNFNHFKRVWPHMDSLSSAEYEGDRYFLCTCPGQIFHAPECRAGD